MCKLTQDSFLATPEALNSDLFCKFCNFYYNEHPPLQKTESSFRMLTRLRECDMSELATWPNEELAAAIVIFQRHNNDLRHSDNYLVKTVLHEFEKRKRLPPKPLFQL